MPFCDVIHAEAAEMETNFIMEMADSRDTLLPSVGNCGNILNGPKRFEFIENNENLKRGCGGVSCTSDFEDCIVRINVGGKIFHTTRATLDKVPDTRLSHLTDMDLNYNREKREWFFDRNPDLFNNILDFYRCDELHFPHNFCGPSIKKELMYWKIHEGDISPCCWNRYREWEEEKKIYDNIDQAFESKTLTEIAQLSQDENPSKWSIWRRKIYVFMEEPMSSTYAQIWTTLFLLLVLMSIGILCIETHPSLRVPRKDSQQKVDHESATQEMEVVTYPNGTRYTTIIEDTSNTEIDTSLIGVPEKYRENDKLVSLFDTDPHPALEYIDSFCTCFFTIEFLGRLIVAPDRIKFLKTVMNVIDILCVLPMWIKYILQIYHVRIGLDLLPVFFLIMMLRVLRICRVLRLARHYTGVKILLLALRASLRELMMLLIFVFIVMLIFSVVIYYAEFFVADTFATIPEGFWWVIITLTTVGYGDMYPKSFSGYIVGSLCALTGILATGLPVPIIANNFNLYYSHAALKENIANRKNVQDKQAENSASKISINFKLPRFSKKIRKQSKDETSSV